MCASAFSVVTPGGLGPDRWLRCLCRPGLTKACQLTQLAHRARIPQGEAARRGYKAVHTRLARSLSILRACVAPPSREYLGLGKGREKRGKALPPAVCI